MAHGFSDAKEFVLPRLKPWLKSARLNEFADQKLAGEIRREELPAEMIKVCKQLAAFTGVSDSSGT